MTLNQFLPNRPSNYSQPFRTGQPRLNLKQTNKTNPTSPQQKTKKHNQKNPLQLNFPFHLHGFFWMFFRSSGGCRILSHCAPPDINRQPSLQHSYKIKQASTETPSSQNYNVGVDTTHKNILEFKKKQTKTKKTHKTPKQPQPVIQNQCFHSEFLSTAPILVNKQDLVLPTWSQIGRIHCTILAYLVRKISYFSFWQTTEQYKCHYVIQHSTHIHR